MIFKKNQKNIHAAIDIGNSKISCMIAESFKNNDIQIKVLGFGQHVSMGLSQGKVTNIQKLSNAIAKAVENAERMAGFTIEEVNCSINGGNPKTIIEQNKININSNVIIEDDVLKALKFKKILNLNNYMFLNREIIKFSIDQDFEVENPIGLKSSSLSVQTNNIFVDKDVISNISKTIALCHLSVKNFYIASELSGIATMIKEERENGAIVIDIGANITSIGVYLKNKLIFSESISVGGFHITSDIVKGLGTESGEAEKIKIMYGSVETKEIDHLEKLRVSIISEDGDLVSHNIPKSMLVAIIKPRVEEIFELCFDCLKDFNPKINNINRLILTGGSANISGITEIANKIFKCNVRIGKPLGLIGIPDIAQSPTFSCLTGLILKSFQTKPRSFSMKFSSKIQILKNWFKENL